MTCEKNAETRKICISQDNCQLVKIYDLNTDKIWENLSKAKTKLLNDEDKLLNDEEMFFICLSILGHKPQEIAELVNLATNTVSKILSEIYSYLENLIQNSEDQELKLQLEKRSKCKQKNLTWQRYLLFFLRNGYKKTEKSRKGNEMVYEKELDLKKLLSLAEGIYIKFGENTFKIIEIQEQDEDDNHE